MAPAYKFTYFPTQALGESIRLLFVYGGIEFEDFQFKVDDWPKLKLSTPFGQVPVLEYNGKIANQTIAIARYVAKQVKLVGANDWEDLEIDAVVDTIGDLRSKIMLWSHQPDETAKESQREPLLKETLPFYLERLDKIVKHNNGHLAVGKLTWADVYFTGLLHYLNYLIGHDIVADYPNLKALKSTVLAIPKIKAWFEKRPKTQY